ncbi:MAG: hypothetical protein H6817_08760, partial [Phycisphaerales bacterium]|nr:hypothetical protein [Phycisphaerales bacterium]
MARSSGNNITKGPRRARKSERCAQCGAKLKSSDGFCQNCGAPPPGTCELTAPTPAPTFKERWLPIILIAALTFIVYIPTLDNEFVSWDDDHYIYKNHQIHYDDGIQSIWFDVFKHANSKFQGDGRTEDRVSHQYYPMVFTIYWVEFRLYEWFGNADPYLTIEENIEKGQMNAVSFHLVSVLLHMVNVMLLIFCFRQLGISNWVAWVATLLFALHPMHASTVAWAAERKNILALMFYLLSLMSYIKMRRDGAWWRYVFAIVLYQAALFSKTVSLTLPVMLFFTDRLLERKWDWRLVWASVLRIVPFAIMSCIAAWTTINVEDRQRTIPITSAQRPLLPAAILLWYPMKMLLPFHQTPVYSLWPVDATKFVWYIPSLLVLALGVLIVVYRRKLGPAFIWALLFYCITQGPMLGIKNINYFQFAYVADHYFYHGAVGLTLMLALGLGWLREKVPAKVAGVGVITIVACALGLGWGARTFVYAENWQTAETFWDRVLTESPDCWPGWYNTGNARKREGIELSRRIEQPTLSEEDRADLRKRADALYEQIQTGKLPDAKRRKYQLNYDVLRRESEWPDLSVDELEALKKKREDLYDDACQRYMRVAEIHKQIVQPIDQWISVRELQRDWKGALEAAEEGARRFPQYVTIDNGKWTCYMYQVGKFAYFAKEYEE